MKHRKTKKNNGAAAMAVTVVLFVLLIGLTAALIMVFRATSAEVDTFDLNRVTSDKEQAEIDITGYFLPEFAGITTDGVRLGISSSAGIVREVFRLAAPAVSEILKEEHLKGELTDEEWLALADEEDSLYFRFHQQVPLTVLSLFSGLYGSGEENGGADGYVYEMLVLPYSESIRRRSGVIRAAVRDSEGKSLLFMKALPDYVLTAEALEQTADSYRSSLYAFRFDGNSCASPTEPVFLSPVSFRNIIINGDTATMLHDSESETETLLRSFGLNPDKLLSTHKGADGACSFIDTRGILYIRSSEIEYRSTSDGGLRVSDLTAREWDTEPHIVQSCIAASVGIWNRIRAIGRLYTGDEADLMLSSVSSDGHRVTVRFLYTVDNLRIASEQPAMETVFENGILRSAKIHTIAVMTLGTRGVSLSEGWFLGTLDRTIPRNVTLVYRNRYAPVDSADYTSDAVGAEWAAVSAAGKEDD
ncbi:MAG: hypothetical protein IJF78_05670 [Clostridia bacterium]|nr:hypothetical protein [Clostridia bacterium]